MVLLGCSTPAADSDRPKVVVTTTLIGDLARRVAGDTVTVKELMGPGVDPHTYQPRASDVRHLEEARLVLYNGLHLEGNLAEMLEGTPKARAVTRDIPPERLLIDQQQPDPHVWFDVQLWILALETVARDLATTFPEHAEVYRQNAANYRQEMEALDAEVRRELGGIAAPRRVLVTAHDAFRYLGRAYDVEVIGLQGVSTSDEAGSKEITRVVDRIVQDQVKAIFAETSVSDDGMKTVLDRCKARGHTVRIAGGKLFSDAMDRPDAPGGTYPGMVRHNVRLIVEALR
jgi:manganese/zinc/iron transport system substrate-binding protein